MFINKNKNLSFLPGLVQVEDEIIILIIPTHVLVYVHLKQIE